MSGRGPLECMGDFGTGGHLLWEHWILQKCMAAATIMFTSIASNRTWKPRSCWSRTLSDRHKGVGGDGVILICPSETADAKMRMFNADGSEGRMCGNGVRCVAEYLFPPRICLGHGGRCRNAFGREAHRPQRAGPADRRHGRAKLRRKKFP